MFSRAPRSCLIVLLIAVICRAAAAQPEIATGVPSRTEIILLGTGTPRPLPDASGLATAVVLGSRVFLFDAGPGIMQRMAAAQLPLDGAEAVFITHLHSDHTLGYPELILTTWVMGRSVPLRVYGPKGLSRMTRHLMAAYAEDVDIRVNGLEREVRDRVKVDVHEIASGVVYEHDGVRVTAFRVAHGSWKVALGYRIDTPDRSIVISGDTAPSEEVVRMAKDCDVLIHEVYSASRLAPEKRPGGEFWPQYMQSFHTSDVELGMIAARAQPRLLILHHIVRMGASDEELLAGVRRHGFTGRTVIARDLDRY